MSPSNPPVSPSFPLRSVAEEPGRLGDVPVLVHPAWRDRFPWLVQGTTGRGSEEAPFDLGLYTPKADAAATLARWDRLRRGAGAVAVAHSRQVHGATVRLHRAVGPGLILAPDGDGHATADPGVLLAVTTADCVPVSLVEAERRAVALVHAGWRGSAAGVVERGLDVLLHRMGGRADRVHAHLGPAICGACYEVGPEVFEALGLDAPPAPTPIDLRDVLARRLVSRGVPADAVTVSAHCTRCGDAGLFSHRAGDGERQVGFLGIRT